MTLKLFIQAIVKFLLGIVFVGVLVFLPAGTLSFFGGWLFMGILFIPMFFCSVLVYAQFKGTDVFRSFSDGVTDGLNTLKKKVLKL